MGGAVGPWGVLGLPEGGRVESSDSPRRRREKVFGSGLLAAFLQRCDVFIAAPLERLSISVPGAKWEALAKCPTRAFPDYRYVRQHVDRHE